MIWCADQKELCSYKAAFQLGETKWMSKPTDIKELEDELWLGEYTCELGLIMI